MIKAAIIMKKFFYSFTMVALCAATLFSCANKEEEIALDENDSVKEYVVHLSISDADTKATFSDAIGLQWKAGDILRWEGNTGNTSHTLSAEEISADGYTASFGIGIPNIINESPRGVFRYNYNSDNVSEWNFGSPQRIVTDASIEFVNGNSLTYTQNVAGEINPAFVFLHSATQWVSFDKSESATPTITASMQLVGSIFRVLPYTTDYNDESIQWVSISLNNTSKRLGGLVYYTYSGTEYLDANQKNYNSYHTATVNLGTAFSLTGVTDKETSKGIYFAVPATNSAITGGYKIVVKTDAATYTYTSSKDLTVGENKVRNIPILLDTAHRVADDAVKGSLRYEGNIGNNKSFAYNENAQSNIDLGYWYARIKNNGDAEYSTKENQAGNESFYNVSFAVIDDATHATADWLTVGYGTNSTHWILNATENTTGVTRSATVTATFPAIADGYQLEDGFATKVITVTQTPALAPDAVIGDLSYVRNTNIAASYNHDESAATNWDLGWLLISTRLTGESSWTGREANDGDNEALYYAGITFSVIDNATGLTADWCTINRPAKNTRWYVNLTENSGAARSATITATFPTLSNHYQLLDGESSTRTVVINQEAHVDFVSLVYNSGTNLWKAVDDANATKYFYYSCIGAEWNGTDVEATTVPFLAKSGSSYTLTYENYTTGRWMNQFFMYPYDSSHYIALNAAKTYNFQVTLHASAAFTGYFHLKAYNAAAAPKYEGASIWDKGDVAIPAGEDIVLQKRGITGVNCDNINLIFDFGTNPSNVTVTIKDIIIEEAE